MPCRYPVTGLMAATPYLHTRYTEDNFPHYVAADALRQSRSQRRLP